MHVLTTRHHWIVRATHWVNALALTIMIGSGLRIFNAYPAFARKGESFCCYPFEGDPIPAWLTFGGWLAGARHWHFAAMWVLVANGLVYLGFIYLHGEWRDLVPRRGVGRDSLEMVKFYLGRRKVHPRQGKHNALQRTVYFALPWVAAAAVISGVAIWKPVQLAPAHAPPRRLRLGALLALPGDAGARGAHARSCLHGVRGRSLRAARHHHRRLRRVEVAGGPQRAPVREPAGAAARRVGDVGRGERGTGVGAAASDSIRRRRNHR